MKLIFLLIPIAFLTTTVVAQLSLPAKPFTVLASGILRRNSPYTVGVKRYASFSTTFFLKLTISGTTDAGAAFSISKNASIAANVASATIIFDSSAIQKGSYNLVVEGEGFSTTRQLTYASLDSTILVQLEKPIYLPGELVKFRVYAFDSNTNAISPSKNCSVIIRNSAYILIEKYENFAFVKGKYEGKLLLGNKAPEGIWSLEASCGDEFRRFGYVYETFEVAVYELPPFYATVKIPPTTPFTNGKVPVSIRASYASRDPVEGTAVLKISRWGEDILTRQVSLDKGAADFDVLNSELRATSSGNWYYYEYTLTTTDSLLNSKVLVEGSFQVIPYKFITLFTGSPFIIPGSAYSYTISIKTESGVSAAIGTKVNVTIVPYCSTNVDQNMTTLTLGSTGTVSSTFIVPKGCYSVSMSAVAADSNYGYWWVSAQTGSSGSIGLYPSSQNGAKLNQQFEVKVVTDGTIREVNYVVTSKGVLLEAKSITIAAGATSASIWTTPSIRYFPSYTVTGWSLNGTDSFVVGRTTVDVRNRLNNYVKLGTTNGTVAPGGLFNFTVDSKCDSTVAFSAVDQRIFQITNSRNEIFLQDIFDATQNFVWSDWIQYNWRNVKSYEWQFINSRLHFISNINDPTQTTTTTTTEAPPMAMAGEQFLARSDFAGSDPNRISEGSSTDLTQVRKNFLKSFLWNDVNTNTVAASATESNNCQARVSTIVSDEISSYIVYGVSMNTKHGIGLIDVPATITTTLPFSINANVPTTIKRNENLILDIPAFNSITQNQNVTFTVIKNDNFAPVDFALYGWTATTTGYEKIVLVKASESTKLQFALKFVTTGTHKIQIRAKGLLAGDAIEKSVEVIFEGIPRTISRCLMTVGYDPADSDLICNYPEGVLEESKTVLATVIGDIIGSALNNLENLIQMPSGCGEQTLLYLMPNVAIIKYLIAVNKLTSTLDQQLKQYISAGIQNELSYLRPDGSFSAFGNSDPQGSVWLTTYAVLAFYRSKAYVTVDENVILNGLSFVASNQQSDGSIKEPGRVIHKEMQGGTWNGAGMNAYIAVALTEMLNDFPAYTEVRDGIINYLVGIYMDINQPYELTIIAYAFLVAGHSDATNALNSSLALKIETETEIYWQQSITPPNFWSTLSLNVEATSYGLMSFTFGNDIHKALKAAKYLIGQQNEQGGFGSSQDTVIALTALANFATYFLANGPYVSLQLTPNAGPPDSIQALIDSTNTLTLQQFQLNSNTSVLNVQPSQDSTGIAITCLICNFYQDPSAVIPSFNIIYTYESQCKWLFRLNVCVSFIPEGFSNMAIVTVTIPSGFTYYQWYNDANPAVSKVEILNSGSSVVFYFNSIGNDPTCFKVPAFKAQEVTQIKGGFITANDYYDTSFEGSVKYSAPDVSGYECNW